jgi:SAM-dependent methyltransferase
MSLPLHLGRWAAAILVTLAASSVAATAQQEEPFEPTLHQPGKDVQWVPTPAPLVEKMLDLARLTPHDRLVDLGSGDGVFVIAAARRGAHAWGVEYDAKLVEYSKRKAVEAGVAARTKFVRGDIFKTDFSDATVVTTFLLPSMNFRLRSTFLAMKPGTRIVANTFGIGDWEPEDRITIDPCERWCEGMLWIVPARVGGTWRTPHGDLVLTQKFQKFTGTLGAQPVEGRLRGTEISFTAGTVEYRGVVDRTVMRVSATVDGKPIAWSARALPAR